ncbi:MAG: DUF502 domain-containing protein [Myxococcota bacterium]
MLSKIREALRRYFVAGILVFAPIGITIWATAWIIRTLDDLLLPYALRLLFPGIDDPPRLFLVGAVFTLLVIILLGVVARHLFGAELVRIWEGLLARVPIARNIYGGVKQLVEAMIRADRGERFNRVVLIEYPRKGVFALAFTTGPARGAVQAALQQNMVNCFVPTTPNPTSGFYLLIPEEEVRPVDLTVEEAFKIVMSAGLVTPETLSALEPPQEVATGVDPATEEP